MLFEAKWHVSQEGMTMYAQNQDVLMPMSDALCAANGWNRKDLICN